MSAPAAGDDPALAALFVPFAQGLLAWPADQRVLFLGARAGAALQSLRRATWVCQQSFKPFADALQHGGAEVREPQPDERFDLVFLLPSRQRDVMRAEFARALAHLAPGGTLVASVANTQGAKSAQVDLAKLAGPSQHLSKHKSRVFWVAPDPTNIDQALAQTWLARDAQQAIVDGAYVSRPGLFAWDRVDAASALLASHLPEDLAGRVADLGAGYGYLATQILARCPQVTHIDLFEAEARALAPAQINLQRALSAADNVATFDLHWHDVAVGLPQRYDAIVSNPPFHQGRADLPALGRAFIASAARALQAHGQFLMVANRHLPYEAALATHFSTVRILAVQHGFKVFHASGRRA